MMLQTQNPPHWSLYKNINNITILSYLLLRLVTSLAHPKKGTTKNAQKNPFSMQNLFLEKLQLSYFQKVSEANIWHPRF